MTTKVLAINKISIRGENETERVLLDNINNLVIGGKVPTISEADNGDLILECISQDDAE